MNQFTEFLNTFHTFEWRDAIDILLMAYLIYQAIKLVRETRAAQLVKGIAVLLVFYAVAQAVPLRTMRFLTENVLSIGFIAMVVVFQPELRRALEQVGRSRIGKFQVFTSGLAEQDSQGKWEKLVHDLVEEAGVLSQEKIGALMVIERDTKLGEIIKTGTVIDSAPSPELRLLPVDAERTLVLRNESVSFLRNPPANPAAWRWRELPETMWNGFRLTVEPVSTAEPVTLYEALFDADALPDELILDRRRDGDRLVPFGEAKPKPLKKLRCDRKIPAGSPLPVLRTNAGTILWAPGIRHSNHAAATPATARLVRFACAAIPAEVQGAGTGTPSGN